MRRTCFVSLPFVNHNIVKRSFALLLIIFSLCIYSDIWAHEKKFQHYTTSEGLSYNTVYDIKQDRNGFIWVATGEGLDRFDSYSFKIYYSDKSENSILSNDIRSLLVTRKGDLFVGTSEGLCLYNPEHDNFITALFNGLSLGQINDIFETSKGKILITSGTGVYSTTGKTDSIQKLPLENGMICIQEDARGNFWTFKRQRLFYFNEKGQVLKTLYSRPEGLPNYIPSAISTIKIDSHDQLWIGTFRSGPLILDESTGKFNTIPLKYKPGTNTHPMYFIRDIAEDSNGKYWIGTEKGLFIYDFKQGTYENYIQSFDPTLASINDNAIYKIFRSRENIMWIGTYFGGLNYYKPALPGFEKIKPGIKSGDLKGKALSQIIKGPDEKIWIATEDAGIAIYDPKQKTFRHILNESTANNKQIFSNIHALTVDKQGNVWSGHFFGGINKINSKTLSIQNFSRSDNDPNSLVNNFVFALYSDPSDQLWVGTMDGIDIFNKKNNNFTHFKPEIFRGKFIYDIFQDNQKNFWIGTNNNTGLFCYDQQTGQVTQFKKENTPEIHSNSFISHCVDSRGKIWFGTRGGGLILFDPATKKFNSYTMEEGLPNNVIYGILEDDHNNLWLSSNKGIAKFNYQTGKIINFTIDHGLVENQFNYKSYFKTDDGIMYFGAVNGLTFFNPEQIKTQKSEPEIHFTNFRLYNKPVIPGKKSVLKKDIDLTDHITLKYNENVISFDFVALNFSSMGKNNFYYFLEGFDNHWQTSGNHQSVTYTNLPPGTYRFHIKATTIYNYPNPKERSITITVRPPFWRTYWAFFFYFLLISGIGMMLYRFNEIRHREKMALNIEKIEKEKLEEIHQHKLDFFTYISHEFKTPLTIILASLDAFFAEGKIPEQFAGKVDSLKRNVMRLQFLINQLIDFRKVETEHAVTYLQYGNVIDFLHEISDAFTPLFKRKELEYTYLSGTRNLFIKFDPDKLEKIVSNLLSNAFKYTPEYGKVSFKIETIRDENKTFLMMTVYNTGNEMTKEQLEKIFNLFYKVENDENKYLGSGIGLTLTQSLVNYLNGTITVDSRVGWGTAFVVKLPYTRENEKPSKTDAISLNKSIIENLMIQSAAEKEDFEQQESSSELEIYFVEDNKEFLKFLYNQFKEKYKVTALHNGAEAWELIQKHVPDLVVTDLMMPQMDGVTLCKNIKSNFAFCHVPVIILTAKSDVESRIESLEVGADLYLPKPFLLSELELQIKNILTAKANLKKHFNQFGGVGIENPVKNIDQHFIEKVTSIIVANIEKPDFGISLLTSQLGIGRTLLHTKLKQLTGLSATEFINTIRLREAQKLLIEEPELTMSEIAYKVGFNDPNYFSRTFKKIFNISPSDFRNKKNK